MNAVELMMPDGLPSGVGAWWAKVKPQSWEQDFTQCFLMSVLSKE